MRLIRPAILCLFLASGSALAQQASFGAPQRNAIIEQVLKQLRDSYVRPARLEGLDKKLRKADFSAARTPEEFVDALSEKLEELVGDKHLGVMYDANDFAQFPRDPGPWTEADRERVRASVRANGFGIEKIERLPGNIGYYKTTSFAPADAAAPAVAGAMNLLAYTDALIIDLRNNGGGSPDGVALLASYLFDSPTHLLDFVSRKAPLQQSWTSSAVAGPRFGGSKDVYILTSKDTFSAAESFVFALRNLKRATVIGETTRGGASRGKLFFMAPQYAMLLPEDMPVKPGTDSNWEGVGIKPDIAVPAADALKAAQAAILRKLIAAEKDEQKRAALERRLKELSV